MDVRHEGEKVTNKTWLASVTVTLSRGSRWQSGGEDFLFCVVAWKLSFLRQTRSLLLFLITGLVLAAENHESPFPSQLVSLLLRGRRKRDPDHRGVGGTRARAIPPSSSPLSTIGHLTSRGANRRKLGGFLYQSADLAERLWCVCRVCLPRSPIQARQTDSSCDVMASFRK